jgi:hypothetical protein
MRSFIRCTLGGNNLTNFHILLQINPQNGRNIFGEIDMKNVKFNSEISISNTCENLFTDSGLMLVKEFMESLPFSDLSKQFLKMEDSMSSKP